MAWPNIKERRAAVAAVIASGEEWTAARRKELAIQFSCHPSAIEADWQMFTRPDLGGTVHTSARVRRAVLARDGRVCQYCGAVNAISYIVEHVIPAAWGGVARPYNLVVSCERCNSLKGRSVWIPRNLDAITQHHPAWRQRVLQAFG